MTVLSRDYATTYRLSKTDRYCASLPVGKQAGLCKRLNRLILTSDILGGQKGAKKSFGTDFASTITGKKLKSYLNEFVVVFDPTHSDQGCTNGIGEERYCFLKFLPIDDGRCCFQKSLFQHKAR